jgi:hypothetical protein
MRIYSREDGIVNHEPTLHATARPGPRKSEELDGRHKDALVALFRHRPPACRGRGTTAVRRRKDKRGRNLAREVGSVRGSPVS